MYTCRFYGPLEGARVLKISAGAKGLKISNNWAKASDPFATAQCCMRLDEKKGAGACDKKGTN